MALYTFGFVAMKLTKAVLTAARQLHKWNADTDRKPKDHVS